MDDSNSIENDKSTSDSLSIDLTNEREKTAFNKWYLKEYFKPIQSTKVNNKVTYKCLSLVLTPHRSRLSDTKLEQILLLKFNSHL